jgi:parallel beta-helix repeat protein
MADDDTHDNIIMNGKFFNNTNNGIEAWGGDNTTITNCYIANNGEYGIQLGWLTYLIYLNDFINNSNGAISVIDNNVKFHSPTPINYTYNGKPTQIT